MIGVSDWRIAGMPEPRCGMTTKSVPKGIAKVSWPAIARVAQRAAVDGGALAGDKERSPPRTMLAPAALTPAKSRGGMPDCAGELAEREDEADAEAGGEEEEDRLEPPPGVSLAHAAAADRSARLSDAPSAASHQAAVGEQRRLAIGLADELQADRQAVVAEAAGDRDRRAAGDGDGIAEHQPVDIGRELLAIDLVDIALLDGKGLDRCGRRDQHVVAVEELDACCARSPRARRLGGGEVGSGQLQALLDVPDHLGLELVAVMRAASRGGARRTGRRGAGGRPRGTADRSGTASAMSSPARREPRRSPRARSSAPRALTRAIAEIHREGRAAPAARRAAALS